jgi:hypothetical protein
MSRFRLRVAGCGLRVAGCGLRVQVQGCFISSCGGWVSGGGAGAPQVVASRGVEGLPEGHGHFKHSLAVSCHLRHAESARTRNRCNRSPPRHVRLTPLSSPLLSSSLLSFTSSPLPHSLAPSRLRDTLASVCLWLPRSPAPRTCSHQNSRSRTPVSLSPLLARSLVAFRV